MSTFLELGVSEGLIKGLNELNIFEPTEIQQAAIPELLKSDNDFIGQAQTGTGKTAAFGLPMLQHRARQVRSSNATISLYQKGEDLVYFTKPRQLFLK